MTDLEDKIAEVLMTAARTKDLAAPHEPLERCQSPIEKLMLFALWSSYCWAYRGLLVCCNSVEDLKAHCSKTPSLVISPQVPVGPYRTDFLVAIRMYGGAEPLAIAIECDGHDFHERTKEQARKDKVRDRFFIQEGITVFRYAGSEIWADALDCATEAGSYLMSAALRSRAKADPKWMDRKTQIAGAAE